MEVAYITIFFIFPRRKVAVTIWIIVELLFLGVVATCTWLLNHTHEKRSRIVGILCVIFGVLMHTSPLTIMKKDITKKSVKYMPFYLSLANFLNRVIWVTFALIRFDLYIVKPKYSYNCKIKLIYYYKGVIA
ncbi:hypothetical protein Patl1_02724 [Pistacia atlantica]|uniref:Uncharacterized protein n=1 Tax=Pistacia atlantica TaxID=434234 RepID=A0ACC1CC37_9ROSI|nr:hypothetical protein Patl1_02724 [Pistacia atlantica]